MQRRLAAILAADLVGYSRLRRHQRAGCALDLVIRGSFVLAETSSGCPAYLGSTPPPGARCRRASMMKPMPRIAVMFAVLSLALVVGVAGVLYLTNKTVRDAAKTAMAPAVGGPFSLIDHKGRAVTDLDYRGKLMIVYFGYTY